MICPACGNENRPGARFCARCGTSLLPAPPFPQPPITAAPIQPQPLAPTIRTLHAPTYGPPGSTLACPRCRQSDGVQTASGANISAPQQPPDTWLKVFKVFRWIWGAGFGVLALVWIGLPVIVLLLGGANVALFGSDETMGGLVGLLTGIGLVPLLCAAPVMLGLAGALLVGVPWLIGRYLNRYHQRRLSHWQKALDKWNRLYYCSRCAGVFLPGQNRLIPLEQMRPFLYEIEMEPLPYYGA